MPAVCTRQLVACTRQLVACTRQLVACTRQLVACTDRRGTTNADLAPRPGGTSA